MSDSLPSHGLQPSRLLCPWDFPGKDTGLTCCFLLPETVNKEGLTSFVSSLCLETPEARFPSSPSPESCSGPHGVSHPALVSHCSCRDSLCSLLTYSLTQRTEKNPACLDRVPEITVLFDVIHTDFKFKKQK